MEGHSDPSIVSLSKQACQQGRTDPLPPIRGHQCDIDDVELVGQPNYVEPPNRASAKLDEREASLRIGRPVLSILRRELLPDE